MSNGICTRNVHCCCNLNTTLLEKSDPLGGLQRNLNKISFLVLELAEDLFAIQKKNSGVRICNGVKLCPGSWDGFLFVHFGVKHERTLFKGFFNLKCARFFKPFPIQ